VRSLKEKIKEAKVFEHIMERSAKSMDEAVQVMRARRDEGIAGQVDPKIAPGMTKEQLDNENDLQQETLRHQAQADQRLKHLLDAIKEELAKKPEEKKNDQANNDQGEQGDQQPKLRAAEGIPSVA